MTSSFASEHPAGFVRLLKILVSPVILVILVETYIATLAGSGLPLPVYYYTGSVLLVIASMLPILLFVRRSTRWYPFAEVVLSSLGICVLALKASTVTNVSPGELLLATIALIIGLIYFIRRGNPDTIRVSAPTVLFVALVTSSDLLTRITVPPSTESTFGPFVFLLISVILVSVSFLTSHVLPRLNNRRLNALLLTLGILFVGSQVTWATTQQPVKWAFRSYFSGSLNPVTTGEPIGTEKRPNVILISLDTLRWQALDDLENSPKLNNFRRLKTDSLTFEKAFAASNWTLPSHASLFTGRPPIGHGAVSFTKSRIYPPVDSYVQYLRKSGYRTGAITGGGPLHKAYGFKRGFDYYEHYNTPIYEEYVPGSVELLATLLKPTAYTFRFGVIDRKVDHYLRYFNRTLDRGLSWIDSEPDDQPFFLFLHSFQIHDYKKGYPRSLDRFTRTSPALAEKTLDEKRLNKRRKKKHGKFEVTRTPELKAALTDLSDTLLRESTFPFSPETVLGKSIHNKPDTILSITRNQIHGQRRLYRGGIRAVDDQLGRFIQALRDRNLYDSSIIVLLSDHGEGFNLDPMVLGHGLSEFSTQTGRLSDNLIRVPLLVKLPESQHSGKTVTDLIQLSDVFPALFRYVGLQVHGKQYRDGLLTILTDPGESVGRSIVTGSTRTNEPEELRFYVRSEGYKLAGLMKGSDKTWWRIHSPGDEERINPESIPRKTRNLLQKAFEDRLRQFRESPNPFRTEAMTVDESLKAELKGLGYF